ncbi:hypothetical protein HYT92_02395 [Candidatus Pacearchaeota archaeon]|nr:hypothetical protein [Candidatus Pacearchaeota archaeon]
MEHRKHKLIGELLIEKGRLTSSQLEEALKKQREAGPHRKIGEILAELGYAEDADVAEALSLQLNIPYVKLEKQVFNPEIVSLISEEFARSHELIALSKQDDTLTIAMSNPENVPVIDDLRLMTGCRIKPVVCTQSAVKFALSKHYGTYGTSTELV